MVVKTAFVDGGMIDEADQPGTDGARVPDPQAVEPRHDRRCGEGEPAKPAQRTKPAQGTAGGGEGAPKTKASAEAAKPKKPAAQETK